MMRIASLATGLAALTLAAGPASAQEDKYTRAFVELNTAYMQGCADGAARAARTARYDEEAFALCTKAIDTEPLSRAPMAITHMNRGILTMIRGDRVAAKEDFDMAVKLDPKLGQAYVNRAALNVLNERYNDAVADVNKAIANGAATAQAYYNRGAAYDSLGNAQRAFRDYQKAAQLDPSWELPKKELGRFQVTRR